MFLVNKYQIHDKFQIIFNKEIYKNLLQTNNKYDQIIQYLENDNIKEQSIQQILLQLNKLEYNDYNNMSNIIICGPTGSGKKTMINILLKEIYGKIPKLQWDQYIVNYNGEDKKIELQQSQNHIILQPNGTALDKSIIQEILLKNINLPLIQSQNINNKFRIILINNAYNLTYNTQTSLRYIMEKYNKTCKFVFICNSINKFIEPIQSRCLIIKTQRPLTIDLYNYLYQICYEQKIRITQQIIYKIIKSANNKIRDSIWKLEVYKHNLSKNLNININQLSFEKYYTQQYFNMLISIHQQKIFDIQQLNKIRDILYMMYVLNYDFDEFLQKLLQFFIKQFNQYNEHFSNIIDYILDCNVRINFCKKQIIHLELLSLKIIKIINN